MKLFIFWAAVFILGMLAGASLSTIMIGSQIDDLHIENISLRDNLQTLEKQIQQLQEKPQKRIVSRIDTHVEFADESDFNDIEESVIRLTVEKCIREWLNPILGQNVAEVNYLLIPGIINREIETDKNVVLLRVEMVVISDTVSIYVVVQPAPSHGDTNVDVLGSRGEAKEPVSCFSPEKSLYFLPNASFISAAVPSSWRWPVIYGRSQ